MTVPLTKETLEASYEFLRTCPPFNKWNLPDGEDVNFKVTRRRDCYARYVWNPNKSRPHTIEVSSAAVGHTVSIMLYMSHEIIHLHLRITGMESKSNSENVHNLPFRKYAKNVCQIHGFDPKVFC